MCYILQALLRQKIQEIKRLELALQHEEHLRSEVELDLEERATRLKDKGNDTRLKSASPDKAELGLTFMDLFLSLWI